MAKYDVIIIGAGPAGYVGAIRCAQLGLKTACAEGRETLGGTCLNVGCIPSKALLHASHQYHEARENFAKMGISAKPSVNWSKTLAYKDGVIESNTRGIEFLFKKNSVDWLKGWASIPEKGKVKVGDQVHEARSVVIATGSKPSCAINAKIDEKVIVSSTGALELGKIPKKLAVIGAGVIGLELGSVFSRLGSEVTVLEYLNQITPGMDGEICKTFQRTLKKQGLEFILGAEVQEVKAKAGAATVAYRLKKDGAEKTLKADRVLVATGRSPSTDGLGLEGIGVATTDRGQIRVDGRWSTTVPGIYAVGDVIEGPMLAHKAEDEAMAVAGILAGKSGHVNYGVIPSVIYTHPEVAAVGKTEEELREEGREFKSGKFSFMGNGRAKAALATDGFVKILADAQTDRILGAHIIGPSAGDMIHEICVAMEFGASAEDVALTCHAHPTYSEAVREAALACGDGAIHA